MKSDCEGLSLCCDLQPLLEKSAWASAMQGFCCPTFACGSQDGLGEVAKDSLGMVI